MKIAVVKEADASEPRVAATPETVKKFLALGAEMTVEKGAGAASMIPDAEFEAMGAQIASTQKAVLGDADVVLGVRRPSAGQLKAAKTGAAVVAIMDPYGNEAALEAMAKSGVASMTAR